MAEETVLATEVPTKESRIYTLQRTRHIKVAFLIRADRYSYRQILAFLSLLKYVFIRCLKI